MKWRQARDELRYACDVDRLGRASSTFGQAFSVVNKQGE
jgi:hypothetical protein